MAEGMGDIVICADGTRFSRNTEILGESPDLDCKRVGANLRSCVGVFSRAKGGGNGYTTSSKPLQAKMDATNRQ